MKCGTGKLLNRRIDTKNMTVNVLYCCLWLNNCLWKSWKWSFIEEKSDFAQWFLYTQYLGYTHLNWNGKYFLIVFNKKASNHIIYFSSFWFWKIFLFWSMPSYINKVNSFEVLSLVSLSKANPSEERPSINVEIWTGLVDAVKNSKVWILNYYPLS